MLLFKGILVGVAVGLASIILYWRWQLSQIPPEFKSSGTVGFSVDIRSVWQFIGGMGIGVGIVATAIFLVFYALQRHVAATIGNVK